MTDIFFSYKSDDRERVRLVRDAFAAQGFDVFWDQEVPAGEDWDTWIRRHLTQSKCAIVFWSAGSVTSDNVRHEATVAKQQRKLIPALLETLTPEQFPMGHYTQQGVDLTNWQGDFGDPEWRKLRREVDVRLVPLWLRRRIDEIETELAAERSKREVAEARGQNLLAQIVKEAQAQIDLVREKDRAQEEAVALEARLQESASVRLELEAHRNDLLRRLSDGETALATTQGQLADERSRSHALEDQINAFLGASERPKKGASLQGRTAVGEQKRWLSILYAGIVGLTAGVLGGFLVVGSPFERGIGTVLLIAGILLCGAALTVARAHLAGFSNQSKK